MMVWIIKIKLRALLAKMLSSIFPELSGNYYEKLLKETKNGKLTLIKGGKTRIIILDADRYIEDGMNFINKNINSTTLN